MAPEPARRARAGKPKNRGVVVRGERIKALRDQFGWTLVDVAALIQSTPTAVMQYEKNRREMGTVMLVRIVAAFRLEGADYLLGYTDRPIFQRPTKG